jgi:hypothetical protein
MTDDGTYNIRNESDLNKIPKSDVPDGTVLTNLNSFSAFNNKYQSKPYDEGSTFTIQTNHID